ncbi:probable replication factor-a protein 1 [Ceraceosorus bombacis]|uniref:Replication protein A subunit n=1 Tax=Ceraceosorus bombacis TaxID=401625 RepID=A0A0P1BCZ0_9BASI|nr:probable replication factor-a protein 1 [Ceraceosorus bombacis]
MKHLVDDGSLQRNCIVRVEQYSASNVQTRRILILLTLSVIQAPPAEGRLGDPVSYEGATTGGAVGAPAAASASAAPAANGGGGGSAVKREVKTYAQQQPQGTIRAAPARSAPASGMAIYPIEGLSPYQNKWTIKARVTSKSDIKHWSNARGDGKLFSVNLLDESGEIKATGFNDAVDKYYHVLQDNKVYFISKAKVNIAKKQFSNLNNEYEITFERDTEIEECTAPEGVPEVKYNFVSFDQLETVEPNETCDIIAVVDDVGVLGEIISKASQKPVAKRELKLVDQSGRSVQITLWGKTAETWGTPQGPNGGLGLGNEDRPIIALKGAKVSDFGGRSLSMFASTSLMVDPDLPEAHGLRGWYDEEGKRTSEHGGFKAFANGPAATTAGGDAGANAQERRTIAEVKDQGLGMQSEKPDYFNTRATVVYIKQDNLFYTACPSDNCNKKVTQESDGSWRCEKCDRAYPSPQYRYILAANVQDYSGQMWLSGFNDIGELLIGHTADELNDIKEQNESEFHSILHRASNRQYIFNCRAKQDTFNDTTRVRYTVTRAKELSSAAEFSKFGLELANAIKSLM